MKFDVKKNGNATILKIQDRRLDSTISAELKAEFLLLCKPKVTEKLVVDLSNVEFCDSSGLSALLIADRTMRQHGGSVHLVHVHQKVMNLMNISMLNRVFTIHATVADAIAG